METINGQPTGGGISTADAQVLVDTHGALTTGTHGTTLVNDRAPTAHAIDGAGHTGEGDLVTADKGDSDLLVTDAFYRAGGLTVFGGDVGEFYSGINDALLGGSIDAHLASSTPAGVTITASAAGLVFDIGAGATPGTAWFRTPIDLRTSLEARLAVTFSAANATTSAFLRLTGTGGYCSMGQLYDGAWKREVDATNIAASATASGDATVWLGFTYDAKTGLFVGYYDTATAVNADPGWPTDGKAWSKDANTKTLAQADRPDQAFFDLRCYHSHGTASTVTVRCVAGEDIMRNVS